MGTEESAVAPTMRQRILAAAVELTATHGWAHVTMARLAEEAGISRQTVYNEIGTKGALAEAMIMAELETFLAVVTDAFDRHPPLPAGDSAGPLVGAIEAATVNVLVHAQDNKLLHAVVSATHGADTELLPLLTTHSSALLELAKAVIAERVHQYRIDLPVEGIDAAIDVVVRVVLSHVMQPSASPERTGADLAWLVGRALG